MNNEFDPIFLENGQYYFWDETGCSKVGPYVTAAIAGVALELYINTLNQRQE